MRADRLLLLLLAAASGLAPAPARAAAPPIEVRIPDCPAAPLSLDAFMASLRVELAGRTPPCCVVAGEAADAGPSLALRVTLAIEPCAPETGEVMIRVRDPARDATTERRIALRDIPAEARPRALALAVAEQVRASAEAAPGPPPAPPPDAGARRGVPSSGPSPERQATGSVMFEARTFPGNDLTIWGLRAGGSLARGRWRAALDAEALAGDPGVPLGTVSSHLLAVSLGVGPRFWLRQVAVDAGARGMFGWAWMTGDSSAPAVSVGAGSAPVASLGAHAAVEVPTGARARLRALVEAGAVTRSLTATVNGVATARFGGFYLTFAVGLAFGPSTMMTRP